MKRVKCASGLTGWRCPLRENYTSLEQFGAYSDAYGLAERLGFASASEAWAANPVIEGSVVTSDFRLADDETVETMKVSIVAYVRPHPRETREDVEGRVDHLLCFGTVKDAFSEAGVDIERIEVV